VQLSKIFMIDYNPMIGLYSDHFGD